MIMYHAPSVGIGKLCSVVSNILSMSLMSVMSIVVSTMCVIGSFIVFGYFSFLYAPNLLYDVQFAIGRIG